MTFTGRGLYASSSKVRRPRRRLRLGWLAIGLVVAVVVLVVGAANAISAVPLSKDPRSDAFTGVHRISLENATHGDITVAATDGDELTVDRTLDGTPLADPDDEIEQEAGELEVDAECHGPPFGGDCRVDYEIGLPAGTELDIETITGAVEISGTEGDVSVETAAGPVNVEGITGNVDVSTVAGAIDLAGVEGSVDAETATGSFRATGSGDAITVQSTMGSVDLAGFDARLVAVETTAGEVDIEGAFTTAEVESAAGAVSVRATERFELLEVESTVGSVDLYVPDAAYRVMGESLTGSRTVDVSTDGDASSVIDATTTAGSLTVRQAD
ncbi:DUF4097 family beta strand repeat-containing protein [Nocardiopsis sediminis]|uniref:DUF4097 family beta strand repeat-containing protein n=1 Tax=Nocardiopsis sediminis TaxID=1778267 RepID=A0ABV8FJA3_9ACTN